MIYMEHINSLTINNKINYDLASYINLNSLVIKKSNVINLNKCTKLKELIIISSSVDLDGLNELKSLILYDSSIKNLDKCTQLDYIDVEFCKNMDDTSKLDKPINKMILPTSKSSNSYCGLSNWIIKLLLS